MKSFFALLLSKAAVVVRIRLFRTSRQSEVMLMYLHVPFMVVSRDVPEVQTGVRPGDWESRLPEKKIG